MPSGRRPYDHTPDVITYSRMVTKETVCIAFTMESFHDLEVKAAEVLNAHVTASNQEKICIVLGPKFGDDAGKSAIIIRAL